MCRTVFPFHPSSESPSGTILLTVAQSVTPVKAGVASEVDQISVSRAVQFCPKKLDAAFLHIPQAPHQRQNAGFAGPGRPHKDCQRPAPDPEGHVPDRLFSVA